MSIVRWSDDYKLDIPVFDKEHRRLIDRLNYLHNWVTADASKPTIAEAASDLYADVLLHFQHEEIYLNDCPNIDVEEHIADHVALKRMITTLRQEIDAFASRPTILGIIERIRLGVVDHLIRKDKQMASELSRMNIRWVGRKLMSEQS